MKQKLRIAFRWYFSVLILLGSLLSFLPTTIASDSSVVLADYGDSYFAIAPNGNLVGWGENNRGSLGDAVELYHPYLARRTILRDAVCISADSMHPMAVDKSGTLWSWGWLEPLDPIEAPDSNPVAPAKVMEDVVTVEAGTYHAAVIRSDGSLWTGGGNSYGELGLGYADQEKHAPSKILDDVSSVFVYDTRTFAVLSNGDLYTWGSMDENGAGTAVPTQIASEIQSISDGCGGFQCLKLDGTVWTWTEQEGMSSAPVAEQVRAVVSGGAIREDDSLWSWKEENGAWSLQHKADQVASAASVDFYLTQSGWIYAGSDRIPHSMRTVSPLFRNLFLIGLLFRFIFQLFLMRDKPYSPPAYSLAIGYDAHVREAEE